MGKVQSMKKYRANNQTRIGCQTATPGPRWRSTKNMPSITKPYSGYGVGESDIGHHQPRELPQATKAHHLSLDYPDDQDVHCKAYPPRKGSPHLSHTKSPH